MAREYPLKDNGEHGDGLRATGYGRQPSLFFSLILVLALVLRLFGLETQSLWADEGGTLALTLRAPDVILRDTLADVHPPLYYWVLHAWMFLFGPTAAAARGLSALCGALAAALTALLARRWFGALAGWIAGIAAAVSPLAIHYSQEARMYALAALLATLLFLALDRWLQRPTWGRLVTYTLAAAALLATHYFAVMIVAAAGMVGLVGFFRTPQRHQGTKNRSNTDLSTAPSAFVSWRPGGIHNALIFCTAHLPLAALYLGMVLASTQRVAGWTATKDPTSPIFIALDTLRSFSVGLNAPSGWAWWSLLFLALLILGALWPLRPDNNGARWAALLWLGVPLVGIIVLSLGQPYYKPRFLLPALPAFHILIGYGGVVLVTFLQRGWERIRRETRDERRTSSADPMSFVIGPSPIVHRLLSIALIGLMLLAAALPLYREWYDPSVWRDDYRGAARDIAATIGPADALILNGQSQIETLDYYLRTPQPRLLLPRFRPLDPAATTADLKRIASEHRRIYGLFYVIEESDPQGVIAGWLDTHAFPSGSHWYGGLQLRMWETGDLSDMLAPVDARFAALQLTRIGIDLADTRPGDSIRVQGEWRADAPTSGRLNLFIHMVDTQGKLIAQYDGPLASAPVGAGGSWESRAALILPVGVAPGQYRLLLGAYDPATGVRLTLQDGADALVIAEPVVR